MNLVAALILFLLLLLVLVALALAVALAWYRRGDQKVQATFGDAARFIRRRGGDPQLTRRLAALADDPRTPSRACNWLDRLVRYRREPVVLAPEWVPVLGWFDEVMIESFMLRRAWRSLPPHLWDEYLPDTRTRSPQSRAAGRVVTSTPRPATLGGLLKELDRSGQHAELLRTLDRRLPDWPISTTVIEVARELLELERNVTAARLRGVPDAVTDRLVDEARSAADALWDLADRLTAAASFGVSSHRLDDRLADEERRLTDLGVAIEEARTGLAELTLAGATGRDDLDRAERRFHALARTADELQDFAG